jgi:hypothetical protein
MKSIQKVPRGQLITVSIPTGYQPKLARLEITVTVKNLKNGKTITESHRVNLIKPVTVEVPHSHDLEHVPYAAVDEDEDDDMELDNDDLHY